MPLKILQIADVHLGRLFASFGHYAERMQQHLEDAFIRSITAALEHKVDAVLIAGDLFDSNAPDAKAVDLARQHFELLSSAKIPAFVVAGTHDCSGAFGSIYESEKFLGLTPLTSAVLENPITINKESPLHIYGISARPGVHVDLSSMAKRPGPGIHVGMLHATVSYGHENVPLRDIPVTTEQLSSLGLDYVALGHIHSYKPIMSADRMVAAYSGSLVPLSFKNLGIGGALMIQFDGARISATQIPVGSINIRVESLEAAEDSIDELSKKLINYSEPGTVAKICITGIRSEPLDIPAILQKVSPHFEYLVIEDKTNLLSDYMIREASSAPTVRGIFIRLMLEAAQNAKAAGDSKRLALIQEALREGLTAFERNRRAEDSI